MHVISVVVLTILACSVSHGSTVINLWVVNGFTWDSFKVAVIMADLWKYCFLLLRLSNKFVLPAILVSTNSYGMRQMVSLPFKAFEIKPLLGLLDFIAFYLQFGSGFYDLVWVSVDKVNSFSHWFAHSDSEVPCLVHAHGLFSLVRWHVFNEFKKLFSCFSWLFPAVFVDFILFVWDRNSFLMAG